MCNMAWGQWSMGLGEWHMGRAQQNVAFGCAGIVFLLPAYFSRGSSSHELGGTKLLFSPCAVHLHLIQLSIHPTGCPGI